MKEIIIVFIPLLLNGVISFLVSVLGYGKVDTTVLVCIKGALETPIFALWYLWERCGRKQADFQMRLRRLFQKKDQIPDGWMILHFAVYPFLFGAVMNLALSCIMQILGIYRMFSNETQSQLLSGLLFCQFLGPGLLNPIAEELLFRGLTYSRMKKCMPRMSAVFLNSLLFAAYHGNPIQMIYALPMGLILITLYERENTLLMPVMFHIGANITTILLSCLFG